MGAFVFLLTQLATFGMTFYHFVYSQTHPDEMIQWSWIYMLLMGVMFVGTVAHLFFWLLRRTNTDEFDKVAWISDSVDACGVFTAFCFAIAQASEWANYSALNTSFPLSVIISLMFLNIIHVLAKFEHL